MTFPDLVMRPISWECDEPGPGKLMQGDHESGDSIVPPDAGASGLARLRRLVGNSPSSSRHPSGGCWSKDQANQKRTLARMSTHG
jgi:hypothetical protein